MAGWFESHASPDKGMDPDYKLFCMHLQLDRKSYVFDTKFDNFNRPSSLKYEREDSGGNDSCLCNADPFSMIDESYQLFLKLAREENGFVTIRYDNGKTVRYEDEEERIKPKEEEEEEEEAREKNKESAEKVREFPSVKTEDPEETTYRLQPINGSRKPMDALVDSKLFFINPPFDYIPNDALESQPQACKDEVVCSTEIASYQVPSGYADNLASFLGKPFDKSEYEKLMSEATARTPVMKCRHLRSASKAYKTNEIGRSYFDHYPSLAGLIKGSDCQVGLKLLRGFFFWLENNSHDGAFMPWLVASSSWTLPFGMLPDQIDVPEE